MRNLSLTEINNVSGGDAAALVAVGLALTTVGFLAAASSPYYGYYDPYYSPYYDPYYAPVVVYDTYPVYDYGYYDEVIYVY